MKRRNDQAEGHAITAPVEGSETTMSFGSVTVKVVRPSAAVVQRNIEDGQAALMRAKTVLTRQGVKITRAKGKPLYFGSSERPDVIIRELDGVRTSGKFVGGRFRPMAEKTPVKAEVKAAKRA